ncbi:transmembrane protein 40 [Perognathus longimembris pacificus]|uniref:transmembrane protein 40 n=1 Tax=Perognathus longimembris pacificus TaxID=214514 RepID=UPI002018A967|nr:transmembrane protein 40 [Perognathus longimembris pacificus]
MAAPPPWLSRGSRLSSRCRGHIHAVCAPLASLSPRRVPGKAMETSGPSSQAEESSGGFHGGDSADEDRVPRGPRKRRQSPGAARLAGSHAAGTEHGVLDGVRDELQVYGGAAGAEGEMVLSGEPELQRRGSASDGGEVEASEFLRRQNIKKDDEFFHFVLLCFGIGALLVCYHYYADWFMSLGVGLLTFASLETVGIYFGLVYRIHSVLQGFVPLLQKLRLLGVRRTD